MQKVYILNVIEQIFLKARAEIIRLLFMYWPNKNHLNLKL